MLTENAALQTILYWNINTWGTSQPSNTVNRDGWTYLEVRKAQWAGSEGSVSMTSYLPMQKSFSDIEKVTVHCTVSDACGMGCLTLGIITPAALVDVDLHMRNGEVLNYWSASPLCLWSFFPFYLLNPTYSFTHIDLANAFEYMRMLNATNSIPQTR